MDATNPSEVQSFSGGLDDAKLRALVTENPGNFDAWTSLIKEIEKASPNDIERIFSVYDAFLSEFPLCYGYWKKYADHRARLSTIDKVVEIYERAVQSAMYSVGLWVNYCGFGMLAFEDPVDIRRLFERALSFVGKDYLCHLLWDKYIEFEYSQKQWSRLAHIYLRTLRFPTKKLHIYHKSFKGLVSICEEEMKYQDSDATEVFSQVLSNCENTEVKAYKDQEISSVIEDLLTPPVGLPSPYTLKKYLSAGEYFYQKASDLDSKIKCFENRIRRPYFHMKLLDDVQLENWHRYLDFVEMQGDFDWTIKLYERCLIPCANYPEFWIRYVEFVETKGGREIANLALARATEIYLKRVPGIHLFCARFKEQTGDIIGARGAFRQCGFDLELHFVENVTRKANMEKRLGNVEAALIIYEKALDMAKEKQDSHTLGILYAQFSQFKYMVTASIDAARDILIKGIQHLPHCKLLLERLIQFEMMHGGPRKVDVLDSIIAQATAPPGTNVLQGMSTIEREDISKLFLEFVDLCGSIHDIRKACDRHRKLFPYQMRPTSSFQDMTSRNGSLDNAKTGGNDYPATLFHHGSGDISTQCSNHHSIPNNTSLQKTTDTRFDLAVIDQSKLEETNDGIKERLQQIETAMAVQETPTLDTAEQHIGVHDSVHEGSIGAQALEENAEVTKQVQIRADHEPQDDLIPPSLETLSINPQEDEIHQPTPTISLDCKALEATSVPNGNRTQDGGDTSEILISKSMVVQSDMPPQGNCLQENDNLQMESDSNSQTQIQTQAQADSQQMEHSVDGENWRQMNNPGEGQMDPTSHGNRPQDGGDTSEILISNSMVVQSDMPPQGNHRQENDNLHMESDSNSQTHIQTQAQPNSQKMVHSSVDGGNWHQMNYTGQGQMDPASHGYPQAQQLQHWQASQQPQYPTAGMQSHTITGQCYPCQPQPWENTQVQQANLAPNQYQVATGQVYPTGTHGWPAQNVQLQTFASVPQSQQSAQPVSHPQAQVYQYPYQSSQQFSHMQSNQGYTPQMWGYYQQHQHQLQQHQQQQIQPQQQQPPQQQLHPQQQQLQLQQYHQQLQQQQIQPQQQLPLQQQPPQQQLHPPQQQLQQQQYHQQQQQQIQMWNYNYYAQQTLPVQYYESSQYGQEYGQQAIGSQGQVADQPNGEVSEHVDPHPQQQVPSSQ